MATAADKAAARAVVSAAQASGITLPAAVTKAWERTERLTKTARSIGAGEGVLAAAVTHAIDVGRDPTTDDDVRKVLTAAAIANEGVMAGVEDIAHDSLRASCLEHADAVLKAWHAKHTEHVATLLEAHRVVGAVALTDAHVFLNQGAAGAEAWAAAQKAMQGIDAIINGVTAYGAYTRTMQVDRQYQLLMVADLDFATWQQLQGQRPSAWDLICAGITPTMPASREELRARLAVIQDGQARLASARERVGHAGLTNRRPDPADVAAIQG